MKPTRKIKETGVELISDTEERNDVYSYAGRRARKALEKIGEK